MRNMTNPLAHPWTLSFLDPADGSPRSIPARVPGNVLGDLFRAGLIPDPYWGSNSVALRPYEFVDWEYRTTFAAPQLQPRERLQAVFEGIDTVADVFVNGTCIGHAENMVIAHRFDIDAALLKADGNELVVKIRSSANAARAYRVPPASVATCDYNTEGLFLRRPMHTYGWDIAPRLVGAGLWRPACIETVKPERWTDLYLTTTHATPKSSRLLLRWNFASDRPTLMGYEGRLTMECRGHKYERRFPIYFTSGGFSFELPQAHLWYPLGSGEQNLYDVRLELIHDGQVVDTRTWRTGVRTIELRRTEILDAERKGEFVFIVNGRRIFIKGSNWVPSNAIHGEAPERIRQNLELFIDLGCNMVRCWGGSVYEDREFYDFCDEHGLLVWQDFMFACEVPPQDEEFLARVRREAEAVVCRLRNHPSLAIWSGDNECDELFFYPPFRKHPPSVNRITREVLPQVVFRFDPNRDYLPSSPYLSDAVHRLQDRTRAPEQHLWGFRDSWKDRFYKENQAIFASEMGYHGMTNVESIRRFIPEEEINDRHGAAWTCHASQPFGVLNGPYSYRNTLMENQSRNFWGYLAEDLEEFMKCSQIAQAEAMKYFIEIFRARKWDKTGIIWWNVIDCWPQFSDAVVDYYYVRKLAYYYIKQAQQPLSLIVSDPADWHCQLTAVNDRTSPASGGFKVTDLVTGETFAEGEYEVSAESASHVGAFRVSRGDHRMLLIEWNDNGTRSCNHYLLGSPPFKLDQYLDWLGRLDARLYHAMGRHEWKTEG